MSQQLSVRSFVDDLLDRTKPDSEAIVVEIPWIDARATFRRVLDYSEWQALKRSARQFISGAPAMFGHPDWAPYKTEDSEVLSMAFYLAETSLEPKISLLDFLKLAKLRGVVFDHIRTSVDVAQFAFAQNAEVESIESAKNASSGTSAGATA